MYESTNLSLLIRFLLTGYIVSILSAQSALANFANGLRFIGGLMKRSSIRQTRERVTRLDYIDSHLAKQRAAQIAALLNAAASL